MQWNFRYNLMRPKQSREIDNQSAWEILDKC